MYQKTTLDNGLRIVTANMPHTRSVTVALYYGVGSRYEPKRIGGVSHFIEHMVFKGTERRPLPQIISEAIEGVGGYLNASTGLETTNYYAKVPSKHFAMALDVLTDMLDQPLFKPDDIEKERQVIIEEINATLDSPSDLVGELFDLLLWGDQPVGWPVGGTRESVGDTTRADLLGYLKSHYLPPNLVVSVAGDIQHDDVVEQVNRVFGDYPRGEQPPAFAPATLPEAKPRVLLHSKETEQANLVMGLPALSAFDPDRYKLDLLNAILGDGMSSRLFVELRENMGIAYSVGSYTRKMADTGEFGIYAGADVERAKESIVAALAEMGKLKREPVSEDELNKVKEYRKGGLVLGLEDTAGVAMWGGGQELRYGKIYSVDEVTAEIDAVTAADITEMANRYFVGDRLALAVVGPYNNAAEFQELLKIE
ncbi:MAG: insulinase family protein [Candidatus Chloroheliales bacterium]|nr:MAG: insulinase family protein [Chloroflexota bacterium]